MCLRTYISMIAGNNVSTLIILVMSKHSPDTFFLHSNNILCHFTYIQYDWMKIAKERQAHESYKTTMQKELYLSRLPCKIKVTTAWDSHISPIWRAIHSVKSSSIITCPTNTTRNCSAEVMKQCKHFPLHTINNLMEVLQGKGLIAYLISWQSNLFKAC